MLLLLAEVQHHSSKMKRSDLVGAAAGTWLMALTYVLEIINTSTTKILSAEVNSKVTVLVTTKNLLSCLVGPIKTGHLALHPMTVVTTGLKQCIMAMVQTLEGSELKTLTVVLLYLQ